MRMPFWSGRSHEPQSSVRRRKVVFPALISAAVGLAYLNALPGAFQFDDYNVIVKNSAVHSWSAWLASMPGIRPVLKLTYTVNWVSGLGPFGFHLFNVLCHTASALCVYLLALVWCESQGSQRRPTHAMALTAALVFALHPAQTEAVSYISGRSTSLMGLFYLGALVAHLRGETEGGRAWMSWLSPGLFIAALLTKETAWTLPFALLLCDAGWRRLGWMESFRRLRGHAVALGALALAMCATAGYRRLLVGSLTVRTLAENALTQIDGQFYLLTRPLLLLHVNIDPDLSVHSALSAALTLKATVLLALVLLGAYQWRARPWLAAGILWWFLHLAPTNSILPRLDVANDRHIYLAIIGPAVIFGVVLWARASRSVAVAAVATLAIGLGSSTMLRNRDYRTQVSLWQATVEASPRKARAWNNLGYAYQIAGNVEAARAAYGRALELDPDHPKALFNAASLPPPATSGHTTQHRK